jgi:hypothetical protein
MVQKGQWVKWVGDESEHYCPYDPATGRVTTGLSFIGGPPGEVVGEFYEDEYGFHVQLFTRSLGDSES